MQSSVFNLNALCTYIYIVAMEICVTLPTSSSWCIVIALCHCICNHFGNVWVLTTGFWVAQLGVKSTFLESYFKYFLCGLNSRSRAAQHFYTSTSVFSVLKHQFLRNRKTLTLLILNSSLYPYGLVYLNTTVWSEWWWNYEKKICRTFFKKKKIIHLTFLLFF